MISVLWVFSLPNVANTMNFVLADTGAIITFGWGLYGQVLYLLYLHTICIFRDRQIFSYVVERVMVCHMLFPVIKFILSISFVS